MLLVLVPLAMIVVSALAAAWVDARSLTARRRWIAWLLVVPASLLAWLGVSLVRDVAYERVSFVTPEVAWAVAIAAATSAIALIFAARLARLHSAWLFVALVPVALSFLSQSIAGLLAPALLLAAAIWPRAAAAGFARGEFGVVLGVVVALLLAFTSILGGVALVADASHGGEDGFARHSWSIVVVPESDGDFTLVVPLFSSSEPSRSLDELRSSIRVVEGLATLEVTDEFVVIHGSGPIRVAGSVVFQGPVGARESFLDYAIPEVPFDISGVTATSVSWSANFSGGAGHSCSSVTTISLRVVEGAPESIAGTLRALCH